MIHVFDVILKINRDRMSLSFNEIKVKSCILRPLFCVLHSLSIIKVSSIAAKHLNASDKIPERIVMKFIGINNFVGK